MTPNEFVNEFYTNDEYKSDLLSKSLDTKSRYSDVELKAHKKDIENLHYDLLFSKVSNEVYSYSKDAAISEDIF